MELKGQWYDKTECTTEMEEQIGLEVIKYEKVRGEEEKIDWRP